MFVVRLMWDFHIVMDNVVVVVVVVLTLTRIIKSVVT